MSVNKGVGDLVAQENVCFGPSVLLEQGPVRGTSRMQVHIS